MHYDYTTHGVCSRAIHINLSEDGKIIKSVSFDGGCRGNLAAISKLVKSEPTERIIGILSGNTCGEKPTSCADQLSIALREALELASTSARAASASTRAEQ